MNTDLLKIIEAGSDYRLSQIENTVELLNEGSTIPFIARYRKERTLGLDEVGIAYIKKEYENLIAVEKRKESILASIAEQDLLTPDLETRIKGVYTLQELEDIYLPFKPKRKTRGSVARDNGLEPLAKIIMAQHSGSIDSLLPRYLNNNVKTTDDALQGALDIIAEWINENAFIRNRLRSLFRNKSNIKSKVKKGKEEEAVKYSDYFNYEESLKKCPSHRFLAIKRGEQEEYLSLGISVDEDEALDLISAKIVKENSPFRDMLNKAIKDGYKRLLHPSLETEFMNNHKEKSDEEAIRVFAKNLEQLLMSPPLGAKRILAIDPGYRTGCKVVCLDEQGTLLTNFTIYPHKPQDEKSQASKRIVSAVSAYHIDAIAIGNGTAGRETEYFIKKLRFEKDVNVYVVSEAGASVYSASSIAREEFPEYDVTVRGAISIGRRLMDPLAELVKIDPKSIGVGQYQHDVDQKKLQESLTMVVENCVNKVGVELNTASRHLLSYVSGLGPQLAQNIVDYRKENGAFKSRKELMKVKRMGDKAFEQAAGFLRINDAENPLDNSAVHPESYHIVEKMARDNRVDIATLIRDQEVRKAIDLSQYVTDKTGMHTLNDIMAELEKPGRDPRKIIKVFEFAQGIHKPEDLHIGMVLPGIVTNITNFGAFVDVGVKQDGLVHISQMADKFISNPSEIVSLHDHVTVKVIDLDLTRKRIQLSMKDIGE